jgi:hypothetical protein
MGRVWHGDGMSPNITKAMAIIETIIGAIAQTSFFSKEECFDYVCAVPTIWLLFRFLFFWYRFIVLGMKVAPNDQVQVAILIHRSSCMNYVNVHIYQSCDWWSGHI